MSKLDRGLTGWASFLLKSLFVMIFPLTLYFDDILEIIILPSNGLLFPSAVVYPEFLFDFSFLFFQISTVLRNFIIGIIIAFPGIYYNYQLSRTPLHKSIWKRGIAFSAVVFLISLGLILYMFQFMFSPFAVINGDFWDLYNKIVYYPSLVIGVFIILPLILRQAIIISVPSDLHYYSVRDIEATEKFNISREKMLSAIFWFILCFAPYAIQYDMYGWYGSYVATSFLMDYRFGSYWNIYPETRSLNLQGQVAAFPFLPFFALIFVFNFAFARDIYRYLRKSITRRRLVMMAILSSLFPLLLSVGLSGMFIFGYFMFLPIPIPFIQVAGFILVRYHRPQLVQSDRVWKGDRTAMWWETERKEELVQLRTTPEKPIRHREETITIPLRDLLLARFRALKSRKRINFGT